MQKQKSKNQKISTSLIYYHKHKKSMADVKALSGFTLTVVTTSILIKLFTPTPLADYTAINTGLMPSHNKKEIVITPDKHIDYQTLLSTDSKFRSYIYNIKVKRNNPGNLRFARQPNAINTNGFAEFPDIVIGFRALIMQIKLDQSRDLTIEQFITKYSPPHENDTPHLIKRAEELTGKTKTYKINNINTIFLAKVIANQEHSIKL